MSDLHFSEVWTSWSWYDFHCFFLLLQCEFNFRCIDTKNRILLGYRWLECRCYVPKIWSDKHVTIKDRRTVILLAMYLFSLETLKLVSSQILAQTHHPPTQSVKVMTTIEMQTGSWILRITWRQCQFTNYLHGDNFAEDYVSLRLWQETQINGRSYKKFHGYCLLLTFCCGFNMKRSNNSGVLLRALCISGRLAGGKRKGTNPSWEVLLHELHHASVTEN